ncbi:MAG: 3-dehydroquinate synthase [Proteobacteria bacterium]|nr:3-dehydroquinate synthase [Pseudomonadota bacterium]
MPRVFLSGLMGSGKSTVASLAAEGLGVEALDLDTMVARRAGKSIAEIFAAGGEQAFRQLERDMVRELLERSGGFVVALGGGTVTHRATRHAIIGAGELITLEASGEELVRRLSGSRNRPLLRGNSIRARLQELGRERAGAYAEAHAVIQTDAKSPASVAEEIQRVVEHAPILVPLGTRSYRVEVGAGFRGRLAECCLGLEPSSVLLITDDNVDRAWAAPLGNGLREVGLRGTRVVLPAGEQYKSLSSVYALWEAALNAGMDRGALVVAVGGGVVGDLAGFVASTLLRGVDVGHVPTSLLSMVDSSIGGKTGFDTRHGKNLIGSFHQPRFVLCDVDTLSTLSRAERTAGLAEVVKSAWLDSERAVCELETDAAALAAGEPYATVRAVRMSLKLKARIVAEDELEQGRRSLLNLGHTIGHAIEAALDYRGMRHGEAVARGMVAAFRAAVRLGHARIEDAERARRLLDAMGLPLDVDRYLTPRTFELVQADKKRQGDAIKLVLPGMPGDVQTTSVKVSELPELTAPLSQKIGPSRSLALS